MPAPARMPARPSRPRPRSSSPWRAPAAACKLAVPPRAGFQAAVAHRCGTSTRHTRRSGWRRQGADRCERCDAAGVARGAAQRLELSDAVMPFKLLLAHCSDSMASVVVSE